MSMHHSMDDVSVSSTGEFVWHSIDWVKANRTVRKLQIRIVKATQEGNWRRVKALQRFLTRSLSGKALAVRRVTENQGKRTPGVDGELWSTPETKALAVASLKRRGYQPLPLKRVNIPKANGKMRPLGIPTMRDRAMQALHLLALQPVAETLADPNSYGFRPERSTADASEQCFNALSQSRCAEWILEADIKGCFDNISHDWLLENIPMDKDVLRKWLKAGFIESKRFFPTTAGTPQGGIISPTLANMTLDSLERILAEKFGRKGTRAAERNKINLVRYADDFIITGSSRELLESEVKPLVVSFLAARGLVLSDEKTKVGHIDEGFDFLGFNIRKYRGKLLIKPARKNVLSLINKVRGIVKENRTATQENLIRQLNPVIRGWANYHKSAVASETFVRVDSILWRMIWRWACRRHPNKSKKWIKARYFGRSGTRNWVFMARTGEVRSDGEWVTTSLVKASDTKIRRHTKIKGEANPFDPRWETYFEDRIGLKMMVALEGRRKLLNLWLSQNGKCIICQERLSKEMGWHVHHIVRRVDGGDEALSNLVVVHPNCHMQVHSLCLTVVKPVSGKLGAL